MPRRSAVIVYFGSFRDRMRSLRIANPYIKSSLWMLSLAHITSTHNEALIAALTRRDTGSNTGSNTPLNPNKQYQVFPFDFGKFWIKDEVNAGKKGTQAPWLLFFKSTGNSDKRVRIKRDPPVGDSSGGGGFQGSSVSASNHVAEWNCPSVLTFGSEYPFAKHWP